ncbi:MAG TPA: ATP-binding protein [Longimicrobiaceae bacterium]|nr:ATP-binding protein [Longimicrobiaceae bacterium]
MDQERSRTAFLAATSRCLAQSLDYEETLLTVAGLALPFLGSWCIVDLVEEDGGMRRLAIVHPDPRKQELAAHLTNSWPPFRDDPFGVPQAVRSQKVEVIQRVDDAMLVAVARDPANLRTLRALGIGSVIVVPLAARGTVHGALTLISSDGGHRYEAADMEMAEDLGARCAMAIDNARLHRDARRAGSFAALLNQRLVIASIAEQELADEARAANLAKSHFISSVTHEIRTPINAIIGYTSLLDLEIAGPLTPNQSHYLARIRASSTHLLHLIEDVLDLGRVEAGRMTIRPGTGCMAEVLASAMELVDPQAQAAGVVITSQAEPSDCYQGDENRVRQILVNVLANAVKFTAPGGRVHVGCATLGVHPATARLPGTGPWLRIDVEDTGIGIAPELQAAVFEPFVQAEPGLTRSRGGTGLGLAISRQLARLMDGDLTLQSAEGEGSCFTLWLPSVVAAA